MRLRFVAGLAIAAIAAIGCAPATAGWHGAGIHLVDGTWIGSERDCASGDGEARLECRTIVASTLVDVVPALRPLVLRAVVANLPTDFTTSSGERRTARLFVGIETLEAVVLDLTDGSRRVVGAACTLSYVDGSTGLRLDVDNSRCFPWPLDWWIEGGAPPSIPPGTTFG